MSARADSAFRTSERILDATLELYRALTYADLTLAAVADRAGVSTQTVIRRFGGKAPLVVATVRRELERLTVTRAEAAPGAVPAVEALADFYESNGALLLRMYADAPTVEGLPEIASAARDFHLDWCRRTFRPEVDGLPEPQRSLRLAQLVAVCDAVTWRVLREDCGLDAGAARAAFVDLATRLLTG
jgi:AcrR family transcriptional regulator